MPTPSRTAVVLTLAAGAAWFVLARTGAKPFDYLGAFPIFGPPLEPLGPDGVLATGQRAAHDVYAHFVPVMAYAGEAVRNGGRGLWWTPLQNCGQPFSASNGLLYPLHWLPVLFGIDLGLRLLIGANLLLGGLFAYALGREIGVRPTAALTGALAFQLGNAAAHVGVWTPLVLEPFMWFPAVLVCVERLLRAPSARWAAALGAACCMAMLPAWPQLVLFLYQLVGLRVLWAIVVERPPRPFASFVGIMAGLVLGPLLDGAQLLPALEVAQESVRRVFLSENEIVMASGFDFSTFRHHLGKGIAYGQPLSVIPCLLASLAFLRPGRRRVAGFYCLAGGIFFTLSFGPATPLFDLYLALPGGRMFREPPRASWVTGFCLSVLVALGVDALAGAMDRSTRRVRWLAPLLAVATLTALQVAAAGGLRPLDLAIGLGGCVVIVLAAVATRHASAAPRAVRWLYAMALLFVPAEPLQYLYPTSASLYANQGLFQDLRARIAPSWRAYLVSDTPVGSAFSFMPKTASLLGIPAITDYEPQTARRFAEFLVMMRAGKPMLSLNAYYYSLEGWMTPGFNRNLLDLAAGRFIVVEKARDEVASVLRPPPVPIAENDTLRVYENPSAVPRALWVPRLEVVRKPGLLLTRLAARYFDPWQVALVDVPPDSGFLGEPPAPDGSAPAAGDPRATFVRDDPEAIAMDVQAPARGFLVLADQYRDGWYATVNGTPVPIQRANYVFRLVEVPAGRSRVEFRYAPRSLALGALLSALALLVMAGALWRGRAARPAQG